MLHRTLGRALVAASLAFSFSAHAQDYPSKLIRIVVPGPGGSPNDLMARTMAEKMRVKWGQPVIVENKVGAAGNVGAEYVSKASPDGYTLLFTPPPPLVINKTLYSKLTYDPEAFVPISVVATSPNALVVHPGVAAESVQQFIAYAKANPGKLNYSSAGNGTTPHLTAEMFQSMAGVNIVHVPHKGYPASILGVLGGQVDMMFVELGSVLPNVRSGKLRLLAVASEKRNPFVPTVPAMSELLPGFVAITWYGMVAPPGTPAAIAAKLSAAISEGLKQPDVVKQLQDLSVEPMGSTPAEMAKFIAQEAKRWGGVIRSTGATVD
jgi:tripartite-type tricarboxylate transporter receptor subunit TctC